MKLLFLTTFWLFIYNNHSKLENIHDSFSWKVLEVLRSSGSRKKNPITRMYELHGIFEWHRKYSRTRVQCVVCQRIMSHGINKQFCSRVLLHIFFYTSVRVHHSYYVAKAHHSIFCILPPRSKGIKKSIKLFAPVSSPLHTYANAYMQNILNKLAINNPL